LNVKARIIAPVTALAAVGALAASLVIGLAPSAAASSAAASSAGTAAAAARPAASALPAYYLALPGGDNFANVPGSRTAVLGDTLTGKRLLTIRAFGTDKFVTVSAAADDRTFVLGANPNPQPPAIPSATEWYLVHVTPGARFRATERKLRIPGPGKDDWIAATALSPNGKQVAVLGTHEGAGSAPLTMWVRVYSVATGALLHSWSGLLNTTSGGYTTLAWTDRGRQLAIGYTFSVTPAGSKRSWPYIGVRLLDVDRPGHNLTTDSRLAWSKLAAEGGLSRPTPLTCAPDLQVVVSPDGTVVCGGYGILRAYTPNPFAKTCPAVPNWASVGFVTYSTATGRQAGTLFQYDTNCQPGNVGVLWTSAAGDRVIGYYSLGGFFATKPVFRFGVFSHGRYTPLPLPPTTTTVPATIAW
jgi:WD40 repeat protein